MSSTHSKRLRGVGYYRMSSAKQEDSAEQQQEWANRRAPTENIDIVREFRDEARAGHETGKRLDFQAMLDFCRQEHAAGHPIDVIVCWATSRFSRSDSHETGWFYWEFRKAGVRWMLTQVEGLLDFENDVHRLLLGVRQEASNHPYVKELAQNVLRGKIANAECGNWNGGRPPFGYRVVYEVIDPDSPEEENGGKRSKRKRRYRAKLVPDEVTGPIVTELFLRYASGQWSLRALCRWLDTLVPPPRSKKPGTLWRP